MMVKLASSESIHINSWWNVRLKRTKSISSEIGKIRRLNGRVFLKKM